MTPEELAKRVEPILLALSTLEDDLERGGNSIGAWEYLDVAHFALQRLLPPESEVVKRLEDQHHLRVRL